MEWRRENGGGGLAPLANCAQAGVGSEGGREGAISAGWLGDLLGGVLSGVLLLALWATRSVFCAFLLPDDAFHTQPCPCGPKAVGLNVRKARLCCGGGIGHFGQGLLGKHKSHLRTVTNKGNPSV